ncbi:MAG: hypothetical protein OXG35_32590 [Acidobacteria bacterium]|nr:hypothetical protein [Acidobacteriota bacterium]
MSTTSTRLTKQECVALRAELVDLGYGQAESETRELFARRLYPVPEHLRALDPSVVLVVGPRGSGKTELFKAFFSEDRAVANAVVRWMPKTPIRRAQSSRSEWRGAYPAGTLFPDTQALANCVRSDETAKRVWHAMLVRRLADRLDGRQRERLQPMLQPPSAAVGDILREYDRPDASPTAALDDLEVRLLRANSRVYVGYDELDTLGGFDWALMARMVRGLVAFWSDYSRRWRQIRAKIFLRSDLFRRHAGMGTADFAKLAANRAELAWSDAALLAMLVKRVANTSERLAAYCRGARIRFREHEVLGLIPEIGEPQHAHSLLERLSGEFMGAGKKKGYVPNWVLAHLRDGNGRISPRTLVRLIELAAGKDAANGILRPPRLIHPTALRQALDEVSDNHVTQGISNEWPWLEGVRARLKEDQLVPWSRQEIVESLDADWAATWGPREGPEVRPPVDRPAEFVDYLIDLGVFRRRSDDRIDVPDLYLSGLKLRRKGGVKIGSRATAGA